MGRPRRARGDNVTMRRGLLFHGEDGAGRRRLRGFRTAASIFAALLVAASVVALSAQAGSRPLVAEAAYSLSIDSPNPKLEKETRARRPWFSTSPSPRR